MVKAYGSNKYGSQKKREISLKVNGEKEYGLDMLIKLTKSWWEQNKESLEPILS